MNTIPLSLKDFSIALGDRRLLDKANFTPRPGSSSVIIGSTGVGKSVLLRAVAGFLPPRVFSLGGGMSIHGSEAYVGGRKTGRKTWADIMAAGLVFVPAERPSHESRRLRWNRTSSFSPPSPGTLSSAG
jgi:ABC-type transporter Mla maintaining outer membrane lipid asymmetry ATPase subunit MlaF